MFTETVRQELAAKYPKCIIMYHIGDFYETFGDDAHTLASELSVTLTKTREGIALAGVPYHKLDATVEALVANRHRVAICETK